MSNFLGDHNWNVDLEVGKVDFGRDRKYPIQIIGTESELTGTWLWGWANEESDIPVRLLACAKTLRDLGTKQDIEELTQPHLKSNEIGGHMFAMVACGVCCANAYYRGPYEGGALFFTMQQIPLKNQQATSFVELINVMSSAISQVSVNHKTMARSFLSQQGFDLTQREGKIVASAVNGNNITVIFDELGRVAWKQQWFQKLNLRPKNRGGDSANENCNRQTAS